jgi:hypothetical protein
MWARSGAALLVTFTLVAGACSTDEKPGLDFPPAPATVPSPDPDPAPIDRSPGSAAAAMDLLCVAPAWPSPSPASVSGDVDPQVAEMQRRVEIVRGLEYRDRVATESISGAEMSRRVTEAYQIQYPKDLYARRTRAWATIGVLPPGTGLREALLTFGRVGVVGYYDPATGELVYIASGTLGVSETLTLAHELTHALDDQHFDLTRLDAFVDGCRDEEFMAALGVVEGSAQFVATQVLREFPAVGVDDLDLAADLGLLDDVPPFLRQLQIWPYTYGHGFVIALERRGGLALVNRALREPPVSTEQVLHPERYPNDLPEPVDVPALVAAGWEDLDVMQVGEEWLREMLGLRIDRSTADAAAAGWDGGTYRAWTDGDRVAVVLRTVWDSPRDAREFHDALELWIGQGEGVAEVRLGPETGVAAFFATDEAALQLISSRK